VFGRRKDRKKARKRDSAAEVAGEGSEAAFDAGGEGIEAVADGCGCDISLVIGFTLVAGVSLLLWSN
jgi:hypothetical protein